MEEVVSEKGVWEVKISRLLFCIMVFAFAGDAFSEEDYERITFEAQVQLFAAPEEAIPNLSCVTYPYHLGSGEVVLKNVMVLQESKPSIIDIDIDDINEHLDLGWRPVTVIGCDINKLASVFEIARERFGFIFATYTIARRIDKTPQVVQGECQYPLREAIQIDLGFGLVLRSAERSGFTTSGCE